MKKLSSLLLTSAVVAALSGCATTAQQPHTSAGPAETQTHPKEKVVTPVVQANPSAAGQITLQQIMSDPQWMGRQPEHPRFSVDGSQIVYDRQRQNSRLQDVYAASVTDPQNAERVALDALQNVSYEEKAVSQDGQTIAYRYKDSVFVRFADGETVQLTRGGAPLKKLTFMTDGRLMGLTDNRAIAINLQTGQREQLLHWEFAEKPEVVKAPEDYIAEEQISLIEYIAKQRTDRQASADQDAQIAKMNPAVAPATVYLSPDQQLVAVSVSPKGDHAIIATTKKGEWRGETDNMPHYIQEDGRIAAKPVRPRVADAKPQNHELWLVDLKTGTRQPLSFTGLPGYNEDVLAEVKAENAKSRGETYQVNRLPRDITLLESWYWTEPSIRWHDSGEQVAVMLEAWDNKDRWIATVDLDDAKLVSQHRLHDDAWINYRFNQFGWLHNSQTLYYQSEQSGYAQLYKQIPGQAPQPLTQGQFITDNPILTSDDKYLYYQANKKHPGIYEIYRVNLQTGQSEAMTDLNGMTDYTLSPDEQTLLLTHSKVTSPPELYIKPVNFDGSAKKITDTVSEQFKALPWARPDVVAIDSSHTSQPIYARVYLPDAVQQGKAHKAVVFNHGAGYLQNAHMGWSDYFREYMFHSMLVQQGYVVMDMDYRASAGYGRDWRTAIYRQMGTPEVQDLRDGVDWLVNNANVDRDRIGTYGGSYGGFLTFMSMFTAPDLFAAGAALRPVTDWAHYNAPYTANILNTPDVDPLAYERSSPIYFAQGLQKPLLINAPMVDDNVFFQDTVRLVQRLIELEKEDFETAIYPVEPHGFVQPSSWLDEYRRIYKLFEENL